MVSLTEVHASNARIATELPARLVGVFVGGTSGIGETTLKQFAKHVKQPRAYFIGRSQEAADRITEELKKLNAEGEYIFIKGDSSLVKNVDEISAQIKAKEKAINLLFLTIGTLVMGKSMSFNSFSLQSPQTLPFHPTG